MGFFFRNRSQNRLHHKEPVIMGPKISADQLFLLFFSIWTSGKIGKFFWKRLWDHKEPVMIDSKQMLILHILQIHFWNRFPDYKKVIIGSKYVLIIQILQIFFYPDPDHKNRLWDSKKSMFLGYIS